MLLKEPTLQHDGSNPTMKLSKALSRLGEHAPIHVGVMKSIHPSIFYFLFYEESILLASLNDELQLEFIHSWDSPNQSGISLKHKVVMEGPQFRGLLC